MRNKETDGTAGGSLRGEEGEDDNYGSREDFYLLGIVLCMCGFLVRYI